MARCRLINRLRFHAFALTGSMLFLTGAGSTAQVVPLTPNDTLQSVRVGQDGRITFQLHAPKAGHVRVDGGDIPGMETSGAMTKRDDGVWSVTVGPVPPGAYRYRFAVDDLSVSDPRNTAVSESNMDTWSMLYVHGADFMDTQNVPHGSIAIVTYYSTSLRRFRRMHVYTPPGYESGKGTYPVLYLLHGAWDTDDAWSSVGRAGFILDNLIASAKAVPMVVIMPAGHTGPFSTALLARRSSGSTRDEFVDDFLTDVKPYVESHYRLIGDQQHRAIAGLSMGGAQTLNIAIAHLEEYGYIGVFSSGIFELGKSSGGKLPDGWEEQHGKFLDDPQLKKGLRLLWFATGREDFLLGTTRATVEMMKHHGFNAQFDETEGAHTWINWRNYLANFAPRLFR